jgi:hypothetical protein
MIEYLAGQNASSVNMILADWVGDVILTYMLIISSLKCWARHLPIFAYGGACIVYCFAKKHKQKLVILHDNV